MKPPLHRLICLAFLLGLPSAFSETMLEVDFTKFDPATRMITGQNHWSEGPATLEASEQGASIDPGATTGIGAGNPALAKGLVECVDSSEGGGFLDTAASYSKITGTRRGYGTGTIATVFQPHFSGRLAGNGPRSRAYFFATNYGGSASEAIVFGIGDKGLALMFGIGTAASPARRVTIEQPDWDPEKWYFLAASWGPSEKPTIYWREIGTPKGSFAEAPELLDDCHSEVKKNVRIGNAGNVQSKQAGGSSMKGKLAFFLWSDSYTNSQQAYESLYQEIVKPK
jgi:hypothetical protein